MSQGNNGKSRRQMTIPVPIEIEIQIEIDFGLDCDFDCGGCVTVQAVVLTNIAPQLQNPETGN